MSVNSAADTMKEATDLIISQAVEIKQLKHDLERQMTIANSLANESERLREAINTLYRNANTTKGDETGGYVVVCHGDLVAAHMEANPSVHAGSRKPDVNVCPNCGGEADNGNDRCVPPNPYWCSKCEDHQ